MHRTTFRLSFFFIIFITFRITAAQGVGVLTPGSGQPGTLSAGSPFLIYTFTGNEGEQVTVSAFSLTPDMSLTVSLLSPSQEQVGASESGLFGGTSLSARLPGTGTYTALVGGTPGDFVILLDLLPVTQAIPLVVDVPATASLSPEALSYLYSFNANPSDVSSLEVRATSDNTDYTASLYAPDGALSGIVVGLPDTCFGIPTGDGLYSLVIEAQNAEAGFDVVVNLRNLPCGGASSTGGSTQPPVSAATQETPDESASPTATAEACTATSGGAVNIRGGAGTEFDIIGVLNVGQSITVVGTSGTGWYVVQSSSIPQGYVAADLVNTTGSCENLPTIQTGQTIPTMTATGTTTTLTTTATATSTPSSTYTPTTTTQAGQATLTYTATYTPSSTTQLGQPTLTYTATYTATQAQANDVAPTLTFTSTPTRTASYTPSYTATVPVPTAPPDANYSLTIPLDSTASTTDFVSFPGGDTEDRVNYDISGMNQNSALSGGRARLILTVSCFGTGTQNVQFFTQGQTYSCGQTIFDQEVTYDSRTGSVLITAFAGQNTYVQWVLTGTATRVN